MRRASRPLAAVLLVLAAACRERAAAPPAPVRPPAELGPRMTMDALHKAGGVPAGWTMTPPPGDVAAGRALFADVGCGSCHKVAGEPFEVQAGKEGPELTGMGAHHPAGYFAEAILNPDAVRVEGPGWLDDSGRSKMPAYPDLTLGQLSDLVAYLGSLKAGGEHAGHQMGPPAGPAGAPAAAAGAPPAVPSNLAQRPTPPDMPARAFFVQSYEVLPGKAQEFAEWFQREGGKQFMAFDGLVSVDTYVDVTRPGPAVTSVFGFRDDQALNAFLATHDPQTMALGDRFDSFVGEHDHRVFRRPPLYRVPGLSAP